MPSASSCPRRAPSRRDIRLARELSRLAWAYEAVAWGLIPEPPPHLHNLIKEVVDASTSYSPAVASPFGPEEDDA